MQVVEQAARAALAQASQSGEEIVCLYGGFTGADWADEYELLAENVRRLDLSDRVVITNDSLIALRAGTDKPYGAILIAGSGGNCAIRAPDGREFIYAYYHDADLQGGGALGRRALNAIYRSATGRELPTGLTTAVLAIFGSQSVDDLLRADIEGRLTSAQVRELTPVLFEQAEDGDPVACRIVTDFAAGYAELVVAGLRRFDMTSLEVDVVLSGGIFNARSELLPGEISAGIRRAAPLARLVMARYEPVVGAVMLALEHARVPVEGAVQDNIEASARHLGLLRAEHGRV
jgi:N-acetylglucosamine kinase-like BadF-type ATPase